MKKIIILAAAIFITGSTIWAQPTSGDSQSASQSVTLNLQNSISIIIGMGFDNNYNINTASGLQSILTNANEYSIRVKSNRKWAITVITASANYFGSDIASNDNSNVETKNYGMAVVYTATQL